MGFLSKFLKITQSCNVSQWPEKFDPHLYIYIFLLPPATGPIRLFTPYKRRRRQLQDLDNELRLKVRRDGSADESELDQINSVVTVTTKDEAWQSLADGIDSSGGANDYQMITPDGSNLGTQNGKGGNGLK